MEPQNLPMPSPTNAGKAKRRLDLDQEGSSRNVRMRCCDVTTVGTVGSEIVSAVQQPQTVHVTEPTTVAVKVTGTSLRPKISGGLKYKGVRKDATADQPVQGTLNPDLNDYASVPISKELLAGKVLSQNKPEPDVKEGEMNVHRENPQNNIKTSTVFKLHRAQLPLFKPQLFGAYKNSMKVPQYTRHKRVIGRRLPIDNFRLNTFNLKLPVSGLV